MTQSKTPNNTRLHRKAKHPELSPSDSVFSDVVVFGGSASGLWVLNLLAGAGYRALLIESDSLGQGQTAASQGIIHGGLKYTLNGSLTGSAEAIRDMPLVWRQCLAGQRTPSLAAGGLRAPYCHLWRSENLLGRLGMMGAKHGLRVTPVAVTPDGWPQALEKVRGEVYRLDEQVISPRQVVANLARPVMDELIRVETDAFAIAREADNSFSVYLNPCTPDSAEARPLVIRPRVIVLAAGIGNAALREMLGLDAGLMQVRSVHMLLARGDLPVLNGHYIEGTTVQVTITTDRDPQGRVVWQIGGGISEDGVEMDADTLIQRGRRLVEKALGGRALPGVQWASYRADKAEVSSTGGQRPDDAFALLEDKVITAWPTKLALVPRLAERVLALVEPLLTGAPRAARFDWHAAGWPAPGYAPPPWEREISWTSAI